MLELEVVQAAAAASRQLTRAFIRGSDFPATAVCRIRRAMQSPCTRNCKLGPDHVCVGCFRHLSEIATWTAMSVEERQQVLATAAARRRSAKPGVAS